MIKRASEKTENDLGLIHSVDIKNTDQPTAILVHGRAGNVEVMKAFLRTIPETWNVIIVQAPFKDIIGGYSWWILEEYKDYTDEISRAVDILEDFIYSSVDYYNLNKSKVTALGFSQGAALLSIICQTRPEIFVATGILAGFVVKKEIASEAKLPKLFIAHGTKDEIVGINKARKGRDYFTSHGAEVAYIEDEVGHKVGISGMKALKAWLLEINKNILD